MTTKFKTVIDTVHLRKIRTISFYPSISKRVNKKYKYVALSEQFLKNWKPCKNLWVAYYRRNLPTYASNTNNRIDRLQDRFTSTPDIYRAIIHLVSFCEKKTTRSVSQAALKSVIIHDTDARISALSLNERDCVLLHYSLKALQKRRQNMNIHGSYVYENMAMNVLCMIAQHLHLTLVPNSINTKRPSWTGNSKLGLSHPFPV